MKKVLVILLLVLGTLELAVGQLSNGKSIIYGKTRTDGYQKITKGFFWLKRPEAKEIYFGGHPEGYTVVTLDADMFVRFIDGEHNRYDNNYIIFPKGEIIYSNNKTGKHYSALCGNEIEFWGRVENTIVIEKEVIKEVDKKQTFKDDNYSGDHNVKDYGAAPKLPKQPDAPKIVVPKTKKPFFKRTGVKIGGVVIGAGIIYGLVKLLTHHDDGSPAYVPGHDDPNRTGVPVYVPGHDAPADTGGHE